MSELDQIQAFMAAALRHRRRLSADPELSRRAAELFGGNDRVSPVEQLEIYREQFWLRHTSALVEDFPGLGGVIGQAAWERLTEEYLTEFAPTSFSLRDLGERLPAFVETRAEWLPEPERAVARDMARLEWAYVELFDAPEPPRLDPARLARIGGDWGAARLVLSPALRLLELRYPVIELRKRLRAASDAPVPIPEPEPACLALYRAELRILHEILEAPAFAILAALERGATLGAACEAACALGSEAERQVAAEVGAWCADWVARGFIADAL